MYKRTSCVNQVKINSLILSSIFEIGDAEEAAPRSRALAVQKEGALFTDEDFPFSGFPVYTSELPLFDKQLSIEQTRVPCDPYIHVDSVHIQGMSSAAIFQIGNLDHIDAEVRIKHFRILKEMDDEQ
ncbi:MULTISPECIES: spore germination protein GerPE [Pontibacillus]|uniref:Spore germination protein GerPE n=1 Tax=Pontibacillus chungwhensis TaxID=265426 RepID=A0ABY8UZM2_9BACI|nr:MULTISPECIES: spore germination protein GerPE [Pontibacillus]MCD5325009.1 spore germination protein GerPE [Pontibacillus sp. HN14]WIF98962.1 spore germination protein GerPE [Pontibacillus chungwhensis]